MARNAVDSAVGLPAWAARSRSAVAALDSLPRVLPGQAQDFRCLFNEVVRSHSDLRLLKRHRRLLKRPVRRGRRGRSQRPFVQGAAVAPVALSS